MKPVKANTLEGFKVVAAEAMAATEKESLQAGADALSYMIKAAEGLTEKVIEYVAQHALERKVYLLVGKGNNGGDALATGAFLLKKGFDVDSLMFFQEDELSSLAKEQLQFFKEQQGKTQFIDNPDQIKLQKDAIVLDGIFGTGFSGAVKEPIKACIDQINSLNRHVLSIDIPSGINGNTGEKESSAIYAKSTYFLGLPKTGFFLKNGFDHVGTLASVDFGLCPSHIQKMDADFCLVNPKAITSYLPKLKRTTHKYKAGHVGIIATSPTLEGAGFLAAKACYRSGAGLVRLFIPKEVNPLFFAQIPETITATFQDSVLASIQKGAAFNSLVIGPGLDENSPHVKKALFELWDEVDIPLVLDAGALGLLQEKFEKPHTKSVVLTPHRGEMARLLGSKVDDSSLKETIQSYVDKHNVTLILKGAPTFIFAPGHMAVICPFGDPGMATGGSGDVLSGMLGALLAKGLDVRDAAITGVYLHAIAGEMAAGMLSSYSLLASDIIDQIPGVICECL